jgi:Tfp pilus assembly pilus retraction ATPase PilT
MHRIINAAVDRGASDLHIRAGDAFRARIDMAGAGGGVTLDFIER